MPFRKGLCKAGMLILSNLGVGFRAGTADYTMPKPGSNTPPPHSLLWSCCHHFLPHFLLAWLGEKEQQEHR